MNRLLRTLRVLAFAPGVLSCETGALNVEDCRTIEFTRCDAARQCGQISDASECRLYYRDHCLHGLPTTGAAIVPAQVRRCADTIKAAGSCARRQGADTLASDCDDPVTTSALTSNSGVCDIVLTPETHATECSFLYPTTSDAGAQTGD